MNTNVGATLAFVALGGCIDIGSTGALDLDPCATATNTNTLTARVDGEDFESCTTLAAQTGGDAVEISATRFLYDDDDVLIGQDHILVRAPVGEGNSSLDPDTARVTYTFTLYEDESLNREFSSDNPGSGGEVAVETSSADDFFGTFVATVASPDEPDTLVVLEDGRFAVDPTP